MNHIDTAQYYGPEVVNELIREALHPSPAGLVLESKVGAGRGREGGVLTDDEPDQLRRGIEDNLQTLGLDALPVVNLRLMRDTGPDAFFDDQLAAMISARDDGLIRAIGLSNITLPHLLHALRRTEVACVQNAYHLANRRSQPVLGVHPAGNRLRALRAAGFRSVRPGLGPRPAAACPGGGAAGRHGGPDGGGLDPGRVPERPAHPRHLLPGPSAPEPGGV